ncbi:hypothetical protein [Rouxiella badensis]|uniref:hypothetical protein n=1 Tax=Rouxiella badensis TaxID=1646377 RepID=UPI00301C5179
MKNEGNKQNESLAVSGNESQQPDLSQEIAKQPEFLGNDGFVKRQIGKEALAIEQLRGRRVD